MPAALAASDPSSLPLVVAVGVFVGIAVGYAVVHQAWSFISPKLAARRVRVADVENVGDETAVLVEGQTRGAKTPTSVLLAAKKALRLLEAATKKRREEHSLHQTLMTERSSRRSSRGSSSSLPIVNHAIERLKRPVRHLSTPFRVRKSHASSLSPLRRSVSAPGPDAQMIASQNAHAFLPLPAPAPVDLPSPIQTEFPAVPATTNLQARILSRLMKHDRSGSASSTASKTDSIRSDSVYSQDEENTQPLVPAPTAPAQVSFVYDATRGVWAIRAPSLNSTNALAQPSPQAPPPAIRVSEPEPVHAHRDSARLHDDPRLTLPDGGAKGSSSSITSPVPAVVAGDFKMQHPYAEGFSTSGVGSGKENSQPRLQRHVSRNPPPTSLLLGASRRTRTPQPLSPRSTVFN